MAVWPSTWMSAPSRSSSLTCMKRFSKIVSLITPTPSATQLSAMNCACMSVGNAGYGAVGDAVIGGLDLRTGLDQLGQHGVHGVRARTIHGDLATGHRRGHQEGAGLDAVGQHFMAATGQALDAFDDQARGAQAFDLRAQRDQAVRQIGHLRFHRAVVENGGAFGQHRAHQHVLGAGDADHVEGP
ncbi:hypothetical protein G6F31_016736 [Rhizopus arrhizus]|nr:hypothetical protein G6F31_016736 [Rhizopus arrhizus]